MKLRYYLRGLGVGILVTALVMSIAFRGKGEPLSDAQIRERALAMGMVDRSSTVLSDLQSGTEPTASLEPTGAVPTGSSKEPDNSTGAAPTGSSKEPDNSTGAAPTGSSKEPDNSTGTTSSAKESENPVNPTKESANPENPTKESDSPTEPSKESADASQPTVTIVIERGSGSDRVSRSLAEAGLVEDAKAYDKYLCDNGYSKGLRAGTYEIPVGASDEEIAGIIAQKR